MSQNDLSIANQGFASFRSDLNSALQALGSTNSGTSAPSTTYANQLFYDTTNNILKIRNEDNDAFISLFTLDQTNDNIESLTINGALTADSLVVDNFTLNGTELDLSSGDFTLDVAGDIILDADGADILLKHDGTHWGSIFTNATPNNLFIQNMISDGDIYLSGSDGGSNINALLLDMSDAGRAFFNSGVELKSDIRISNDDGQAIIRSDDTSGSSATDYGDIAFKGFRATSDETTPLFLDGATGFVGRGTTSPSTSFHVRGADATDTLTVGNTVENTQCTIRTHQDDRAVISATDGGTNRSLAFATGTTERARFDGSTGNLMVGSSSSGINLGRIVSVVNLASYHTAVFQNNTNNTGGLFLRLMNHAGQDCGSISQTGTTSSQFTGTSDYRVKENIKYDFDGTSKIKQIKPCVFNFIADGVDSTQEGFIAHELQEIVPIAVVGKKDEMETYTDDDGKEQTRPRLQGVDNGKIVPLLVKTIQELEARITALEGA